MKIDFARVFSALFPATCQLCNAPGVDGLDICQTCLDALPHISRACSRCALPLAHTAQAAGTEQEAPLCGKCLQHPPVFDRSISLFEYRQDAAELMLQLKFKDRLVLARLFGQLLVNKIILLGQHQVDAVLPVPLHNNRLRWRGFNQSAELSRMVCQQLNIPVLLDHVQRSRNTSQQTGLDAKQRRKNMRRAFEVVKPLPYRRIAIVDDVVTTGSTANELAKTLKKSGVETVVVWSIARAPIA